jgi:hypothetical protein
MIVRRSVRRRQELIRGVLLKAPEEGKDDQC